MGFIEIWRPLLNSSDYYFYAPLTGEYYYGVHSCCATGGVISVEDVEKALLEAGVDKDSIPHLLSEMRCRMVYVDTGTGEVQVSPDYDCIRRETFLPEACEGKGEKGEISLAFWGYGFWYQYIGKVWHIRPQDEDRIYPPVKVSREEIVDKLTELFYGDSELAENIVSCAERGVKITLYRGRDF